MPYHILVVDDDSDFRDCLRDYLYDYEIKEACCGDEALDILRKPNEIDLVLLDVMMPGHRGTEILKEMKELAPGIGIVILTGYSSEQVAIESLRGHADQYVDKIKDLEKLKDIVAELLNIKESEYNSDEKGMDGRIERVKEFVNRNYHKKVGLEHAAEAVYLSPKYLSRIFREKTNLTFSRYKLTVKIKKAKELLKETEYTISQISEKLGYQNLESFIQIFKKTTGDTPARYKNKIKPKKRTSKNTFPKRKKQALKII
ncbi:MAG: response regulator [Candidatus Omnitrophota bacterium]